MSDQDSFDDFDKDSLYAIMAETEKLAKVGGWKWDIIKDVWTFSDNWLHIHGCSDRHLTTADLLPIAHPDDRTNIQAAFDKAVTAGIKYEIEHRIIRQDTGEERYIRALGKPKLDSDGKVLELFGSAQDITEQKLAEHLLKESEKRLKVSTESGGVGLWELNLTDLTAWRSLTHDQIFGYESLLPKWTYELFLDHVVEEDRPMVEKKFGRALENNEIWDFQCRIIRKDGAIRWIHAKGKPEIDKNQNPIKMNGTVQDISERKRIEKELRVSEEKFRSLAENVPGLVLKYKLNPDGSDQLIYISKSVEDIFEVSQEDAFKNNKLLWNRIHEDDLEDYIRSIKESAKNFSLWEQQHRLQLPDGRVKWLHSRGVPLQQDDGSIIWDTIALDITEQKRVQKELYEINETLKVAQSAAKIGSWWYNPVTQIATWTEEMFHIFGIEPQPEALPYEDHRKIIHPEDWDLFDAAVSRAALDGIGYDLELRITAPNGGIRHINTRCEIEKDEYGKVKRLIGTTQDITDKKKIENELKRSEERYNLAMIASKDGLYDWDLETNEIYYSPSWKRMLGYDDNELPNDFSVWEKLTEPEDIKRAWEMQNDLINKRCDRFKMEFKMKHKNGHWVDIFSRAKAIFDDNGKAIRIVGTHVDITERKKIEESIRKSEARYRTILQTAIDGFWITDINGHFLEVNTAYSKMSGYSQKELLTMQISDIEASENAEDIEERIKKGMTTGYDRFESFHHRKDNSTYPVEISFTYLDKEGGQFVVFVKDISERKEAEAKLLKNQYYLAKAQEIGKIGTWELNIPKNSLIWTDENYKIFGVPLGTELNYEIFLSCVHPEDRAYVDKKWRAAINKEPYDIMHRVVVDNKIKWVREKADIHFNSQGEPTIAVGFTQDLTGIREIENALQESEKKFRTMFEKAPLSYQSLDKNGCFTEVNQTWLKTMGYTREEVLGKNFSEFLVPEWKTHFKENFPRFKAVGEILGIEFEMVKKDGSTILVSFHGKIGKDEKGEFKQTHCIFQNITSIRKAEESSNRLKERLESLWNIAKIADSDIKTISDHVLAEVQKMTQSHYAFYGFLDNNQNEMILHAWSHETMDDCKTDEQTLHFPIDKAGIWAEAIKEKKILTINDFDLDRPGMKGLPDGHIRLTRIMVVPYLKDGKVISVVAVANKQAEYSIEDEKQVLAFMRNVQLLIDRKAAEQEAAELMIRLQQAQKMESIGTLAGGIAHDFNNILFPIIGMSELLLEDLSSGSPEREHVEEIYKAGKRGSDLVKQILAFSRQSEHKMIPTRIQNIIKEVFKLSRSSIPTYIQINQDIQHDCGMVMADPTQIHQIGMNMITNAYHALEETGGEISVTLKQTSIEAPVSTELNISSGTYALLSISDNGHGISDDLVDKIFTPYFTTKEKGKGTGLGLAVVYGIVKEHKGTIKVSSKIGKGTTFDVYLPLMRKASGVEITDKSEELIGGNEHILLVDDEAPIVKLEKQILERMGYTITSKLSSIDALESFIASPESFDLVISDMTMPNMTGDQLSIKIRSIRSDIPIIICTGFSERLDEERINALEINGMLSKPVIKSDMVKKVRDVLDNAYQTKA